MSEQKPKMMAAVKESELRAALLFASKDQTRFILNGVCIEVKGGKHAILVGTNGRALVAICSEADPTTSEVDGEIVIASAFAQSILALCEKLPVRAYKTFALRRRGRSHSSDRLTRVDAEIRLDFDGELLRASVDGWAIESKHATWSNNSNGKPQFPVWRSCVPSTPIDLCTAKVSSENLERFFKAAKAMGDKDCAVEIRPHAPGGAIEIRSPKVPKAYALIMSYRIESAFERPAWTAKPPEPPKPREYFDLMNGASKVVESVSI